MARQSGAWSVGYVSSACCRELPMPRHLSTFQSRKKKSKASEISVTTNIRTVSLEAKLMD